VVYPYIHREVYTHHGTRAVHTGKYTHHGTRATYIEGGIPTMVHTERHIHPKVYPPWCQAVIHPKVYPPWYPGCHEAHSTLLVMVPGLLGEWLDMRRILSFRLWENVRDRVPVLTTVFGSMLGMLPVLTSVFGRLSPVSLLGNPPYVPSSRLSVINEARTGAIA